MSADPSGLLLCDDLIFTSKVVGTSKALGLIVRAARKSSELVEMTRRSRPVCVIVDLHNPGLDLLALMTELRSICETMPRVVGYGSHVEAAMLRAAREAGCDPVWPRSKFVEELPQALPVWLSGEPPQ